MQDYLNVEQHEKENERKQIVAYLENMLQELNNESVKRDVVHSIKTLKEEFLRPDNAREFMAEALLMYLEKQRLPHWQEVAAAIRRYFA
ncbi:transcriptional regulator, TetR family domain protein [Anoxybacillus amylolyticus]|uniref:Transcriptional regulator, TetR family domain protein n=2 Tax=Anoxybacteroides amylolyticum TaxID=294699 RepID=A0A167TFD1_9BACL|nr:transcriptional regulator, TetR family domain protein [Anoxybacillus amylolyticus]